MISTAPIPTLQREFYTREDVAELLRVSLRTVDEWVSGQKITHFRKGRNVRFAREAVAAFILDGTVLARGAGQAEVIGQAQVNALRQLLEPVVRGLVNEASKEGA